MESYKCALIKMNALIECLNSLQFKSITNNAYKIIFNS